ncbi:MAG TPA: ComF family protein [Candidatus Acidoferrum sp.]|jgi:ComF family protein|nr:ComF family protein [Candidatus Acidoferrum sp.]
MAESPSRSLALRWIAEARDAVTGLFIPAPCRLCGALLGHSLRIPICHSCLDGFSRVPEKICDICGLPLPDMAEGANERLRCSACRLETYAFDRARSFAIYEKEIVRAVLLLKFDRIDPLAKWFATRLAEIYRQKEWILAADVVVPVPLHREREKERGYNQAELLSRPLAKLLKLPHQGVLLVRKRPRPAKLVLTLRERWAAVRGAFEIRPGSQVDNRRVLLLDDVMTTGATLDACSKALRDAGAKSVVALTVARAAHNPLPGAGES